MGGIAPVVLVVENDADIREIVEDVLVGRGYIVEAAEQGQLALDRLARAPRPDLILLDLTMPVMDGWEMLAHKRADPAIAEIPVVVMSAVRDVLPDAGFVGVIRKPMTLATLLEAVACHCPPPARRDDD